MNEVVEDIYSLLENAGSKQYGRESVSQLEHARQCALLAEESGSGAQMIVAALLHDIGHLVDKRFHLGQEAAVDRHHEAIGAAFLQQSFAPIISESIRLHVPAKRYLCLLEADYFATLSPASVRSLELQGGIFTALEAENFIAQPFAEYAVTLRRWDDLAKVPDLRTPSLDHYIRFVEEACLVHAA